MNKNVLFGYLWITFGLFLLISFGGRLFLQLLGIIFGFMCIFKGLRNLSMARTVYNYSVDYFDEIRK